jgi:hypothetical protein
MSVELESAARLAALRDKANAATGGSADTLAGAVDALIAGYGQGGGGGGEVLDALIDGKITEITSNAKSIRPNAMNCCFKLKTANFPLSKKIENYAFQDCTEMVSINIPMVTGIGTSAFARCYKVEKIVTPLLSSFTSGAFWQCFRLRLVNMGRMARLPKEAFRSCGSLRAVILPNETLVAMENIDAFRDAYHYHGTVNGTYNPEGLMDGYVYIPRALVASYQTATNWAALYATHPNVFRALEDYTVDGTITGEFDESKI